MDLIIIIIIIIIVIIMSSTPLSTFFSHGYLCPGESPIIDVETQGWPKSHPIEIHYFLLMPPLSPHSPDSTLFLKSLNPRKFYPIISADSLCLWSLTPTTTAITIIIIIIIITLATRTNNNKNPIKGRMKGCKLLLLKVFHKRVFILLLHKTSWCGLVWNLPNQVSLIM